jgi:phosphatidylinositol alpha 1,6-mannosyltransferase
MRAAVAALASDAALRALMGAQARLSVHGRGWAGVCDELIGHYQAVLGMTPAEHAA